MSTSQKSASASRMPFGLAMNANMTGSTEPVHTPPNPVGAPSPALSRYPDWEDKETRELVVWASVEQSIAFQITENRIARGWTQEDLAKKMNTKQPAIARLEDPLYGKHGIPTLLKVANAMDCALVVRLIPFSQLANFIEDNSPGDFLVQDYKSEITELANSPLRVEFYNVTQSN